MAEARLRYAANDRCSCHVVRNLLFLCITRHTLPPSLISHPSAFPHATWLTRHYNSYLHRLGVAQRMLHQGAAPSVRGDLSVALEEARSFSSRLCAAQMNILHAQSNMDGKECSKSAEKQLRLLFSTTMLCTVLILEDKQTF